ncbi:MAG: inositol monophosphatase [Holosporaceae bacterium]|jgi:myo-inositol-1(or 4)-monophosphatase|nr:inositol monophosphatase [Holosporaceae bacterium]
MISVKLPLISSTMTVMTNAAVKASRGLLRDFSELENLQVSMKSNRNFVTNADLKSDKVLKKELLHARPSYSVLSEEAAEIVGEDPSYRWIVDPLDGTVNYMHGFPHWAISIALEKDGEIVAAVTYDPVKNEMFQAEKGKGAFLNDRKLRVSGKRDLSGLLITFGTLNNDILPRVFALSPSIRKTGSMTLNMAYLAAGRTDIMYSPPNPNRWDIAAGILLIKEAGGILANRKGEQTTDLGEIFVMTNVHLLPHALNF